MEVVTKTVVCDKCHSKESVRRWRVTNDDGKTVSLDLCQEHSELLTELFAKFPHGKRGQSVRVRPVVSEETVRRRARQSQNAKAPEG